MKKLFSLLMALVLVISMIPMMVSAEAKPDDSGKRKPGSSFTEPGKKDDKKKPEKDKLPEKDNGKDKDKDKGKDKHKHDKKKPPVNKHDDANHTSVGYGWNSEYHWIQYACGCRFNVESHVDPKTAEDDYCTCGYHFSDNADLVTLWVNGCPPIKKFNKNITEYKLTAYTYKDVKEIKIATNTYHSQATVELPEDLTLKEGENKFEVKVTAENQKNTKVYTLIITKEAKK